MKSIYIHPTCTVGSNAIVGDFTKVWHYSHVENEAKVGENCNLGQNTYIGKKAIVGNCCRIANSVAIFDDVELKDFVFCGPFMVFTHISFPRAAISRKNVFLKTIVEKGVTLGANSTILPGLIIGEGAFVAAGAVLTKSCPAWALMVGSPAKQVGWVSAYGERMNLPLVGEGIWKCKYTGDEYILRGDLICRRPGVVDILSYKKGQGEYFRHQFGDCVIQDENV